MPGTCNPLHHPCTLFAAHLRKAGLPWNAGAPLASHSTTLLSAQTPLAACLCLTNRAGWCSTMSQIQARESGRSGWAGCRANLLRLQTAGWQLVPRPDAAVQRQFKPASALMHNSCYLPAPWVLCRRKPALSAGHGAGRQVAFGGGAASLDVQPRPHSPAVFQRPSRSGMSG